MKVRKCLPKAFLPENHSNCGNLKIRFEVGFFFFFFGPFPQGFRDSQDLFPRQGLQWLGATLVGFAGPMLFPSWRQGLGGGQPRGSVCPEDLPPLVVLGGAWLPPLHEEGPLGSFRARLACHGEGCFSRGLELSSELWILPLRIWLHSGVIGFREDSNQCSRIRMLRLT